MWIGAPPTWALFEIRFSAAGVSPPIRFAVAGIKPFDSILIASKFSGSGVTPSALTPK
jgi:hypothetical protein